MDQAPRTQGRVGERGSPSFPTVHRSPGTTLDENGPPRFEACVCLPFLMVVDGSHGLEMVVVKMYRSVADSGS